MTQLPQPKYGPDGRPIKKNLFNTNNLNSPQKKQLPKNFQILLFIIIFLLVFSDLVPKFNLISMMFIIFFIIFAIILTRGSNPNSFSQNFNTATNSNQNNTILKYSNKESDYNQNKVDKLIEEFNKK